MAGHRLGQQRLQAGVDLDGDDLVRAFGKLLGQHADAGADLQRAPAGADAGGFRNARADAGVDDEVLAKALGQGKVIAGAQVPDDRKIGESHRPALS